MRLEDFCVRQREPIRVIEHDNGDISEMIWDDDERLRFADIGTLNVNMEGRGPREVAAEVTAYFRRETDCMYENSPMRKRTSAQLVEFLAQAAAAFPGKGVPTDLRPLTAEPRSVNLREALPRWAENFAKYLNFVIMAPQFRATEADERRANALIDAFFRWNLPRYDHMAAAAGDEQYSSANFPRFKPQIDPDMLGQILRDAEANGAGSMDVMRAMLMLGASLAEDPADKDEIMKAMQEME